MSHFYGVLHGARGRATRCGSKGSGVIATAASWNGAIETYVYIDDRGRDCFRVYETTWHGAGKNRLLAEGVIGKEDIGENEEDST